MTSLLQTCWGDSPQVASPTLTIDCPLWAGLAVPWPRGLQGAARHPTPTPLCAVLSTAFALGKTCRQGPALTLRLVTLGTSGNYESLGFLVSHHKPFRIHQPAPVDSTRGGSGQGALLG